MSHHEKITFPLWSLVSLYVEWVILASHVFRKCLTLIYYDFFWFGMILYDQVWIHSSNYVCYVSQNTVCLLFSFFTPNDLDSNVIIVFFLLVLFWIFSFTCDLVDLEETSILKDLEKAFLEPVWRLQKPSLWWCPEQIISTPMLPWTLHSRFEKIRTAKVWTCDF